MVKNSSDLNLISCQSQFQWTGDHFICIFINDNFVDMTHSGKHCVVFHSKTILLVLVIVNRTYLLEGNTQLQPWWNCIFFLFYYILNRY